MLNHIGISISDISEIKDFYQDILGMEIVKDFSINEQLAKKIFGAEKADVYLLKKDDLLLELFIPEFQNKKCEYDHICINVNSRDQLIEKARAENYECITITKFERYFKGWGLSVLIDNDLLFDIFSN